jgi:hypothetical protein
MRRRYEKLSHNRRRDRAFIRCCDRAFELYQNFNRRPSVILTSTGCDPPCWAGIMPNQTSSEQVAAILEEGGIFPNDLMDMSIVQNRYKCLEP